MPTCLIKAVSLASPPTSIANEPVVRIHGDKRRRSRGFSHLLWLPSRKLEHSEQLCTPFGWILIFSCWRIVGGGGGQASWVGVVSELNGTGRLPMLTLKPKQAYLMEVMRQHGRRKNPIHALQIQFGISWRCHGMLAGSTDRSVDETKSLSGISLIVDGIDQR